MDEGEPEPVGDPRCVPDRRPLAVDEERSRVEVLDPGEDLDQRALAGPVLADEADDLACAEREVDAAERVDTGIAFDGSRTSTIAGRCSTLLHPQALQHATSRNATC